MQYFRSNDNHLYAYDGDDSAIHLNVDDCLINILTRDRWDFVVAKYNLDIIPESEFLLYYKVLIDSFNELLFKVTSN